MYKEGLGGKEAAIYKEHKVLVHRMYGEGEPFKSRRDTTHVPECNTYWSCSFRNQSLGVNHGDWTWSPFLDRKVNK